MKKSPLKLFLLAVAIAVAILPLDPNQSLNANKKTNSMMLTVHLKHQQSMTLNQIGSHLDKTGFWKHFPPSGVEVVSWRIVMGIGHVVTLRFPPSKLRDVNLSLEKCAWGGFRTEFYPTYDFYPVWKKKREEALKKK